jgi:hypothetical protein
LLQNDTGSPFSIAGGASDGLPTPMPPMPTMPGMPPMTLPSYVLPTTVSDTPGSTSLTYQVSNSGGVSAPATIVVESTNKPPSDYPGMYQFAVISPDPDTVCPPYMPYMPMPGDPPPPPGPLGGMTHSNMSDVIGSMFGSDPDGDPTTAVLATMPSYGSVTLTPYYNMPGVGTMMWYWSYDAAVGYCNVVDTFSFTVTDNASESTTTKTVHLAITNKPIWNWLTIEASDDLTYWGSNWEAPVTGNVQGNDINPDGLSMTTTWASTPTGFTGDPDGSFSFQPLDIAAFMTGSGETISYTVTDANGSTDTATLRIKPKILNPGEGAGGLGFSVSNGPGYTNGLARILAYPNGGNLHVNVLEGPSAIVSASGPGSGTLMIGGPMTSLQVSAIGLDIGPIFLPSTQTYYSGSTNLSMASVTAGDVSVSAGGNIASVSALNRLMSATAGGSIGDVSAGEHILYVSAGTTLQKVIAGGRIGQVSAGDSINDSVSAGSSIDNVQTTQGDIVGPVTAPGNIYRVHAGRDILGGVGSSTGLVGEASAGRNISGDNITAQTEIYRVYAGDSITKKVKTTTGAIYLVQAQNDITDNISAATDLYQVLAGTDSTDDITGEVTAGGDIGTVSAGGSITGKLEAAGNLWAVRAGATLSGDVKATGGSIGVVSAQEILSSTIKANNDIDSVTASRTDAFGGNILSVRN